VNGETPRRRSNQRPHASARRMGRMDGPGSTPLRRSPPKAERRCDRGSPQGVIASESGLTARLPRATGPSVAQERRFDLRMGEEAMGVARTRPRGQESTKRAPAISGRARRRRPAASRGHHWHPRAVISCATNATALARRCTAAACRTFASARQAYASYPMSRTLFAAPQPLP